MRCRLLSVFLSLVFLFSAHGYGWGAPTSKNRAEILGGGHTRHFISGKAGPSSEAKIWNLKPLRKSVFYGYDKTMGAKDNPNAASNGGAARYVSTSGSDSWSGSIHSPWRTISYAINHVKEGDTVYIHGGVYYGNITLKGIHGTSSKRIEFRSYPGEWAIIDGTGTNGKGNLVRILNSSWLIFRNLEIRNSDPTKNSGGIYSENLTDTEFHNIYFHNNNSSGFSAKNLYRVNFYNCTSAYNENIQSLGNSGDGFTITSGGENAFFRCVANDNSDDGFDNWASVANDFVDCISAKNGKRKKGNGNGFKLGTVFGNRTNPGSQGGGHTLVHCIALGNRSRGFDENGTTKGISFTDCIACNNAHNWNLPHANNMVTNCLSFGGSGGRVGTATTMVDSIGQVFGGMVSAADFESIRLADMNNRTVGHRFFYPTLQAKVSK